MKIGTKERDRELFRGLMFERMNDNPYLLPVTESETKELSRLVLSEAEGAKPREPSQGIEEKPKKRNRRDYNREYQRRKVRREKETEEIRERLLNGGVKEVGDFDEFREHVRIEALRPEAPAAVLGIYKEILKLNVTMKREEGIKLTADEIVKRNLEAERQLEESGYSESSKSAEDIS